MAEGGWDQEMLGFIRKEQELHIFQKLSFIQVLWYIQVVLNLQLRLITFRLVTVQC